MSDISEQEDVNVKDCFDSSSSHSAIRSPDRHGDISSSSPGTASESDGDVSNESDAGLENTAASPPSSPIRRRGVKRTLYSRYKENPSEPIPRQTLKRWQQKRLEDEAHEPCTSSAVAATPHDEVGRSPINTDQGADTDEEQSSHESKLPSDNSSANSTVNQQPYKTSPDCFIDSSDEESESGGCDTSGNDSAVSGEQTDVSDISNESSVHFTALDSDDEYYCDLIDPFRDEGNLYPGCTKSADEAVFELLNIYIQNNLSKRALKDVLRFYTSSLPIPHKMPTTTYSLLKYVENLSVPMDEIEHFYCRPAMHAVEFKEGPCQCGSFDIGVFYELSIESRLKFLFEHRGLSDLMDRYSEERNQRDGRFVCDVVDGSEYSRTWQNLQNKYKVTLILNTDGVRPHKSSKAKMWPLMFTIMEVPPRIRASFTIVWGIWFDKTLKPKMNLYLKPFVTSLVQIHNKGGIFWLHPSNGNLHQSPVRAPLIIADAPARAGVLNMQEHQAKYACNACEQKTSKLPAPPLVLGEKRKIRKRRFLFKEEPAPLRTHESMARQGRHAAARGTPKKGLKGRTVVEDIPLIDLSKCVVGEYMHSVLIGVVEHLSSLWFFSKGDWYIGGHLTQINEFLCSIHPPDFITRLPRTLDNFCYFKASEFRSFLLYYSLIAVAPFLPEKYVQHWMLLVEAIFLLLSESISEEDFVSAETMLRLFVRDLGELYGNEHYTYNVHQLTHLVLYTRQWGGLWCNSAFSFEGFNGTLSKMIHGLKHEGRQLINSMYLAQCAQLLKTKVANNSRNEQNITPLGKPLSCSLSEAEASCLAQINTSQESVQLYGRIMIGKEKYSSEKYDKNFKRNNSCVEVECNGKKVFGSIILFGKFGLHIICLISVYQVVHTKIFFHTETRMRVKHMIPVEKTEELEAYKVEDIKQKLIKVGDYLCFRPNCVENNL